MASNTSWQDLQTSAKRHLRQLDVVCGICSFLGAGSGRRDALCEVLDMLDSQLALRRGVLTLLSDDEKVVRVVSGRSDEMSEIPAYRVGEGITAKVMATGEPIVVVKVSQEPLFPNRFERWNVTKQELSFICVPVIAGGKVIGALSVDRGFDEQAPLEEEVRILSIVATAIANDVQARREKERERSSGQLGDSRPLEEGIGNSNEGGSYKERVNLFERALIIDALKHCDGNLTATARLLQATPRVIRYRVKELGIDHEQYREKKG